MTPRPLRGLQAPMTTWSPDTANRAATWTASRLADFGVRVHGSCRLIRAKKFIAEADHFSVTCGQGDWATDEKLAEVNRTIFEQHLIVRHLAPPDALVRAKLASMLKGPDVPRDGHFDRARDTQAELFAAVLLYGAGYTVSLAEPDLRISSRQQPPLGVAVKRVTSDKQFRRRIRKAQDQLAAQNLHGFIVVSAERVLWREYILYNERDMSRCHYALTDHWLQLLRNSQSVDRVVAVVGLCTSLICSRRRLEASLHFHPIFSADEPRRPSTDDVRNVIDSMVANLTKTIGPSVQPANI